MVLLWINCFSYLDNNPLKCSGGPVPSRLKEIRELKNMPICPTSTVVPVSATTEFPTMPVAPTTESPTTPVAPTTESPMTPVAPTTESSTSPVPPTTSVPSSPESQDSKRTSPVRKTLLIVSGMVTLVGLVIVLIALAFQRRQRGRLLGEHPQGTELSRC
jgi:hypothetical protein